MGGSKKQTIGYQYFIGMHMILCHGPIDCISRIQVDKKTAWSGLNTGGAITVNSPTLFGGEDREGGVSGNVDFDMGAPDQGQNSYLLTQLGSLLPAFRGVVGAILNQCYVGNNPYLKNWSFLGTRIYKTTDGELQWYPEKAAITRDPDNPIIYTPIGSILDGFGEKFPVEIEELETWVVFDLVSLGIPASKIDEGTEHPDDPDGPAIENGVRLYFKFEIIHPDFVPGTSGDTTYEFEIEFYTTSVAPENLLGTGFVGSTSFTGEITGGDDYHFEQAVSDNIPKFCRFVRVRCVPTEEIATFVPGSEDSYFIYGSEATAQPNADMNPAHIIRECLTNPDWGMGYNTSDIDDISFAAAADLYYNESMGLSLVWDRQMLLEDFIKEVARHVDTAVYVSRQTGQYVLKPIRFDYDPDTLLVLDPSNITKVSNPNKPTFGELSNSLTVKFWNYLTSEDDSVSVEDPAMILMNEGQAVGTTVQYPGFTTVRNATLAAQRDLKALSSAGLSCTIEANRVARVLNIGDTFKFTWPRWQVENLIMRVNNIEYGDGKNNKVRINCSQDKYSTPMKVVATTDGSAWVDPAVPAVAVTQQIALEVPYFELVQQFGQTMVDDALETNPDLGYVIAASVRAGIAANARMWVDAGAGYEDSAPLDFCPTAITQFDISADATAFNYLSGVDTDAIVVGTFFQIGEEICRIDSINSTIITCGRGCLDTTPQPHSAGTVAFFWDQLSAIDPTEYLNGETLLVKITPVTSQGPLDLADAIEMEVDLVARAFLPYPPGQFQIDGAYYPTASFDAPFDATWVGRDRTQQTSGEIYDHTEGNIGPEVGTTYRVRMYVDGVLDDTVEPATSGLTLTPSVEGLVRVEVHSVRDGLYSFQPAMHEFYYGPTPFIVTDADDYRVTEDGDVRTTED